MKTRKLEKPETLEVAKLGETTYFGVIIAWAQEFNRYVQRAGGDYEEATEFFEEVGFLPRQRYFPGLHRRPLRHPQHQPAAANRFRAACWKRCSNPMSAGRSELKEEAVQNGSETHAQPPREPKVLADR